MHRAKKAGIALDIERKLEEKYNEEDALGTPDRVIKWINEILKGEHAPCTRTGWRHLQFHLRDGTVLCKFINKLLESDDKPTVKFSKNSHTAFIAMENIEHFNKGAARYGIDESDLFQSIDLYEGRKGMFLNIINCLNRVGFLANEKGFQPQYEAIKPPERDSETWSST